MDFPTLVYLLALGAYSLFTWWKKNKAPKNAQKPAQQEAKPEVPDWMKEIFGESFDVPKSQPIPEAAPSPRQQTVSERKVSEVDREPSRKIATEKIDPFVQKKPIETAQTAASVANKRVTESMAMPGDVAASSLEYQSDAAYDLTAEREHKNDYQLTDWREAIILAEILKPYDEHRSVH